MSRGQVLLVPTTNFILKWSVEVTRERFGDIKRLVEQTLDPMVSACLKNIAQTKTLMELIQQRTDIEITARWI
jgi:uncharacterized membrane protein YqiK